MDSGGSALGTGFGEHQRRAVGRQADRHRIESDRREDPPPVDRLAIAAVPGLDHDISHDRRGGTGRRGEHVAPQVAGDPDRHADLLLERAVEDHLEVRLAGPADQQPCVAGGGGRGRRGDRRCRGRRTRMRRRGTGRRATGADSRRRAPDDRDDPQRGRQPTHWQHPRHREPPGVPVHGHVSHTPETGSRFPAVAYSIDSAIAIVASRPRALSMRYVVNPSVQTRASPTQRLDSSTARPSVPT